MLDSPGACIPQSQTVGIIEFFLMPDEICLRMTPTSIRMGSVGSLPGVPQTAHAHGQPGAINLPGRRAVLVVVGFQRSRQRLQPTKPSGALATSYGEEFITSTKPIPGRAVPRGPGTCCLPLQNG